MPLFIGDMGRDRIEVSTLRRGRKNPGSNPGHGTPIFCNSTLNNMEYVESMSNLII